MESIAERAGVAVQTVYFAFRTKDDLLQAVYEWAVLGDEGKPPPMQDWNVTALAGSDARDAIPAIVAGIATIHARVAPMLPVFDAISPEPAGAIHRRSEDLRRSDMAKLASALARKTPLRKGMTRRRAGIGKSVTPHTLRHAFITAALDAGVPLRDVQEAASHADPRTTIRYDRARGSLDRHATYIVAAYVAGAAR